jgi:hypothetical protein
MIDISFKISIKYLNRYRIITFTCVITSIDIYRNDSGCAVQRIYISVVNFVNKDYQILINWLLYSKNFISLSHIIPRGATLATDILQLRSLHVVKTSNARPTNAVE